MKRAFLACFTVVSMTACSEAPTAPAAPADLAPAFSNSARSLVMLDECDGPSFNLAIGPGTCSRNAGLKFDQFVTLLQTQGTATPWRFNPAKIHVPSTTTLDVVNNGGEAHTFTAVAQFGGGFIPFLNALTGNFVPAPECVNPNNPAAPNPNLVFVPGGGHTQITVVAGAATKYMCCIHPWMRSETN